MKAFLGEFGTGEDEMSCHALTNICRSLSASPDVWLGWAAWAGGSLWPTDYVFNLEPRDAKERPQTRILASFANGGDRVQKNPPGCRRREAASFSTYRCRE